MDWFLYDNGLRHERVKALFAYASYSRVSLPKFAHFSHYLRVTPLHT